ncbi:MAG TPA: isochorismatase family cysteine hydrolase [Gemmatimonadaceae bacterium]|nr:isochorismatase family cysteine hydrolase [Gemmatimonadaceae bacterium]
MDALVIVDAQNEFSRRGLRAVPNHASALSAIIRWLDHARAAGWPIAFIQHHNRPHESRAFVPGSWGAELSPGVHPQADRADERLFQKDVYGAFTTTALAEWLRQRGAQRVVVVGFYAHMCLSTSVREALVRDFEVSVDPAATGARDLQHETLGHQSADEVVRSALLQLIDMGATVVTTPSATGRSTKLAGTGAA